MESTVAILTKDAIPSRRLIEGTTPTPDRLAPVDGDPLSGVRVVLAPLCGMTDAVFRRICFDHGVDLAVTEMISAEGLVRNSPHVRSIRHLNMGDGPLALQIFGSEPDVMGEAAAILSELKPRFVDINFGCPVRKIVNRNGGSAVLKDLKLLGNICKSVVDKSRVPVSAKIRAGWDKPTAENVSDIARVIESSGVSLITVHARTKAQGFKGKADWGLIKVVKDTVRVPVVGNGDVIDSESYVTMKESTGCDAVMIGRSAIGNPWIFEEIRSRVEGREYTPPTPRARVEGLLHHVRLAVDAYGEPVGLVVTRRIMAAYLKRLPNARRIRSDIMCCRRLRDLEEILGRYLHGRESEPSSQAGSVADPQRRVDVLNDRMLH
jgi:tRNA-dihydrouridine synthase B